MTDPYLKNHPQIALNRAHDDECVGCANHAMTCEGGPGCVWRPGKVWFVHPKNDVSPAEGYLDWRAWDGREIGRMDGIRFITDPAAAAYPLDAHVLAGVPYETIGSGRVRVRVPLRFRRWSPPAAEQRDIELRSYGVPVGIDPPEIAKLRNEAMRAMLDNIDLACVPMAPGAAVVAAKTPKKAAELPTDILSNELVERDGWYWEVKKRRDGIVREKRTVRTDCLEVVVLGEACD